MKALRLTMGDTHAGEAGVTGRPNRRRCGGGMKALRLAMGDTHAGEAGVTGRPNRLGAAAV
jgi:hypothetical protein